MKYQAEHSAVELGLLDIDDRVYDNEHRMDYAQKQEIQSRVELIRLLLKRNLPLKAKQQLKFLDRYIDQCLYNDYMVNDYLS
jgi:hypothetical protein